MKRLLGFVVLWVLAVPAWAQLPAPPLEEMRKLDFFVGTWEGEGWMAMGPGAKETSRVVETARYRLDGAVLEVEGVGRTGSGAEERITHHALGIMSFNRTTKSYGMRAYRADGQYLDVDVEVREKGFVWGFETPQTGRIRYTMNINEKGQWHEIGEMSRDQGATWNQFFEMTLDRKKP